MCQIWWPALEIGVPGNLTLAENAPEITALLSDLARIYGRQHRGTPETGYFEHLAKSG